MQRLPSTDECPDTAPEAEVPPGALRWSAVWNPWAGSLPNHETSLT